MAGENKLNRNYGKKIKLEEVQKDLNKSTCSNDMLKSIKEKALEMFKDKTANSFEKTSKQL